MSLDLSPTLLSHTRLASSLDLSPLKKLIKEYLTNCIIEDKSQRTIDTYAHRLNDLSDNVSELTPANIRLYFQNLIDRELSASTRNAYYRCIRTFCNWLVAEGYLEKTPLVNIKPPRIPQKMIKPFTLDDIRTILFLCSGNGFLDIRNRALVLVFLDTGLRLAEMANINREDIDIIEGIITVVGKGNKERRVRIGKTARKALYKYLSTRDDELPALWLTEERRPLTRDGIQITIKRLCNRVGIHGGPHKLRHTFAINAFKNGAREFEVQLLLGHSTLEMTRRYMSTLSSVDAIESHVKFSPVDGLGKL